MNFTPKKHQISFWSFIFFSGLYGVPVNEAINKNNEILLTRQLIAGAGFDSDNVKIPLSRASLPEREQIMLILLQFGCDPRNEINDSLAKEEFNSIIKKEEKKLVAFWVAAGMKFAAKEQVVRSLVFKESNTIFNWLRKKFGRPVKLSDTIDPTSLEYVKFWVGVPGSSLVEKASNLDQSTLQAIILNTAIKSVDENKKQARLTLNSWLVVPYEINSLITDFIYGSLQR